MTADAEPIFRAIPVVFEVYDDIGGFTARIEQFDEHAVKVEVRELVGADQWRPLADAIQSAIDRMEFAAREAE